MLSPDRRLRLFLLVLLIFAELTADHRHRDGHHQDAAGDTEGVNGDTENLQNAIAEEQRRQEDDRHRQVGGEVGLITHRSRLIAGHTDEYRNNANRVNQGQISR